MQCWSHSTRRRLLSYTNASNLSKNFHTVVVSSDSADELLHLILEVRTRLTLMNVTNDLKARNRLSQRARSLCDVVSVIRFWSFLFQPHRTRPLEVGMISSLSLFHIHRKNVASTPFTSLVVLFWIKTEFTSVMFACTFSPDVLY